MESKAKPDGSPTGKWRFSGLRISCIVLEFWVDGIVV